MGKSRNIRLGDYILRIPPPPLPPPQAVSSVDACAAVEAFCKHVNELSVRAVDMIEVSDTGIKFRRRAGQIKSGAVCVDLGLHGTKATSENVAAVLRERRLRKNLEDMFDAVRANDLSEAKFKASMISAAVYLQGG